MFSEMIGRPEIRQASPFGQRLAEARREKGLTQPELGKLLGMSRERVDYYERRAKNPARSRAGLRQTVGRSGFSTRRRRRAAAAEEKNGSGFAVGEEISGSQTTAA